MSAGGGTTISATEAERLGLVNRVLPVELFLEEAKNIARKIAAKPVLAIKAAKEAVLKADQYRYRDRRNRKRDFRRLWITRINAAARQNELSYSQFMHGLQLAGVELDRKILADIAVRDADTFRRFAERAREALAAG